MASEDKEEAPVLKNIGENIGVAEGSDDFIIIELIGESNSNNSSTSNITPDPQSPAVSIDSGYEDFVELSIEDVQQGPEVRSQKDKRSLYGIRLFQYSPESEGNIFITNEEL